MTVNWDAYVVFDPGVVGPLHALPRSEARAAYDRLMSQKAARIEELRSLVKAGGIELDTSDSSVQELNDWFRREVEGDPAKSGRLRPAWYSVVNDIGIFLGDVMIARSPRLRWEFFTAGAKSVSYQRHVIMGLSGVPNPKFNIDPDLLISTYAHRVVAGDHVEDNAFLLCRAESLTGSPAMRVAASVRQYVEGARPDAQSAPRGPRPRR